MIELAISYIFENWIAIFALVISFLLAVGTLVKNRKVQAYADDKELMEQLKLSLENAYGAIVISKNNDIVPHNDRISWLTSARHIVRYRQLKIKLKTSLYKTICDEHEEYWRNKFYLLLERINDSMFFEYVDPDIVSEVNIEPRSAAIIYSFSTWNQNRDDPIDSVKFEDTVVKYDLFSPQFRHFREYIERRVPEYAEKVKKIS